MRKQVYFRDTNILECWQVVCGAWQKLDSRDAFDDLAPSEYGYHAFDSMPENWLGNRKNNPMPYVGA